MVRQCGKGAAWEGSRERVSPGDELSTVSRFQANTSQAETSVQQEHGWCLHAWSRAWAWPEAVAGDSRGWSRSLVPPLGHCGGAIPPDSMYARMCLLWGQQPELSGDCCVCL